MLGRRIIDGKPGGFRSRSIEPLAFSLPLCSERNKAALLLYLSNQHTRGITKIRSIGEPSKGVTLSPALLNLT